MAQNAYAGGFWRMRQLNFSSGFARQSPPKWIVLGTSHQEIYQHHIHKFQCGIATSASHGAGCSAWIRLGMPWHGWKQHVRAFKERFQVHNRSKTCLRQYWRFSSYVVRLPPSAGSEERWSGMKRSSDVLKISMLGIMHVSLLSSRATMM